MKRTFEFHSFLRILLFVLLAGLSFLSFASGSQDQLAEASSFSLSTKLSSPRADTLKNRTDSLVKYIDRIKAGMLDRIQKDKPYKPFLVEEGNALELKALLTAYKEYVEKEFKNLHPEGLLDQIDLDDRREEDKVIGWEHYYLEDVPLAVIIANLTKLKNSLMEIETSITTRLH
jgi:hypothetical protein